MPLISQVSVSPTGQFVTWNVNPAAGVTLQLSVDGKAVPAANIHGPFAPASGSGLNYTGFFGPVSAGGTHTFVITATNSIGNVSTAAGQFIATNGAGPVISQVVFSSVGQFMTFNVDPATGVTLQVSVDGITLPANDISGPFTPASGAGRNYAAFFGPFAVGSSHTYVITATDGLGNVNMASGQFTVTSQPGPVISQVAFSSTDQFMTWNVDPALGVTLKLSIDGRTLPAADIRGPFTPASGTGLNYEGVLGTLTRGSTHTFVITATDAMGNVTIKSGQFTVPKA